MIVELTKEFLNSLLKTKGDKYYTDTATGMVVRARGLKNQDRATVYFYYRGRINKKVTKVNLGSWPATSINAARKEYYRVQDCVIHGKPWQKEKPQDEERLTVGEAWIEWRMYKDKDLAPTTLKKYESIYKNYLVPHKNIPLVEFDARYIKVHIFDLMIKKGVYSFADHVATTLRRFFDYCLFMRYLPSNPLIGVKDLLPKVKVKHYASFDEEGLKENMVDLFRQFAGENVCLKRLLQLHFYTLLRSTELRTLRWEQVDGSFRFATVKTKCHPEFKVALCTQAQEIIKSAYAERHKYDRYVCPNTSGNHYSSMALNRSLERKGIKLVVHGIRACGRQWMQEAPGIKESVAELCLAHVVGDKTMQAYNRGTYFDARMNAMQQWGDFVEECVQTGERLASKSA